MMFTKCSFAIAILVCFTEGLWHPAASDAAIIAGYDPVRHDRFLDTGAANPDFFLDESQLSGVALLRAVLITPRHYISAAHVTTPSATFRGSDGVLRTYTTDDSAVMFTRDSSGELVESDIRIHRISEEVHESIRPLPIVVGDLQALVGSTLIALDQAQRAGRNVIDGLQVIEFSSGDRDTLTTRMSYDTDTNGGTGGLGIDEIGLLGGDSGNASLIEIDGTLGVLGAHMGIAAPPGSNPGAGDRYDSFSTLIGGYEDQIRDYVGADGYQFSTLRIVAVPEATTSALWIGLAGAVLRRRRRRRRCA
ncbi:MAG: hypothetical protein AAGJ83_01300 [Planctomycetota bacterium]